MRCEICKKVYTFYQKTSEKFTLSKPVQTCVNLGQSLHRFAPRIAPMKITQFVQTYLPPPHLCTLEDCKQCAHRMHTRRTLLMVDATEHSRVFQCSP